MAIRLLLFDLGRVLVDFDQDRIAHRLIERSKRNFSEILSFYRKTNIFDDFECGRIGPGEALGQINGVLGADISMEDFEALWSDIFFENPGMEDLVKRLRPEFRRFIVSDTNVLHYEFIKERFPIVRHFEEHILSFKVGARKPDRRMYEAALERAGVSAAEAFFIDDKEKNVEGARKLGITAMHYRSVMETEKALETLRLLTT